MAYFVDDGHKRGPDLQQLDLVAWTQATDDEVVSSINEMLPFPNVEFLRYVAEHRPACLERALFALRLSGQWDREAKLYEEELRTMLGEG